VSPLKLIPLLHFNLFLDLLCLIMVMILLISCLSEKLRRRNSSIPFMMILSFTALTLLADMVSWLGEGHPNFAGMTISANTIGTCSCYLAILFFLYYLKEDAFHGNDKISLLFYFLCLVCIITIGFWIGDLFFHYAYEIDEHGHYVHEKNYLILILYLAFPLLSFLTVLLITVLNKRFRRTTRVFFVICTLFPMSGLLVDYFVHGVSMAYIGFVISILMVYTYIFREKQYVIDSQRNALMLSQINPHFTYNTLSAIAALCDISPEQAKNLTLEFSVYLRHNLTTLSCEDLIPFAQEMNHVDCYLKIEKARFREKLNVAYSIRCKEFNVPPLTIQPIVENAVRHGITKKVGGGTVHIAALSTPKYYVVEVRDDGVGFDPENMPRDKRAHVGLDNVRKRVREMCRGDVQVRSIPGVGTRVTIIIPKKNNKREASS
jgi:hypothetical protein